MEVTQRTLLDIMADPIPSAVPVYQRIYSWTAEQCRELFADALQAAANRASHFSGVILYEDIDGKDGPLRLIIDGQQRITTLVLLLSALRKHLASKTDVSIDGADLDACLIWNGGCKLMLNHLDGDTLPALIFGTPLPSDISQRLVDNQELFAKLMAQSDFDPLALIDGLGKLEVIAIGLDGSDYPQYIFENLNSKGLRLATADLVRNFLWGKADADGRQLYRSYWKPFEDLFDGLPSRFGPSDAIEAWLASEAPDRHLESPTEAFAVFKSLWAERFGDSAEAALQDLLEFGRRYAGDDVFRKQASDEAERWLAGKPRESVSELRMFGD